MITISIMYLFSISVFHLPYQNSEYGYHFDKSMPFDVNKYTKTIDLADDDKVLLLTDLHYKGNENGLNIDLLDKMITDTNPKLIIIAGDNCFRYQNYKAYERIVELFDSYKIPWATIFGNHDSYGLANKKSLYDILSKSEYSLFEYGPNNIGAVGNYIINISNNDKVIHSFLMFDTPGIFGYGMFKLTKGQIAWYEWAVRGLLNEFDGIKTSIINHVPINEFNEAYAHGELISGQKREKCWTPIMNSGLFERVKSLNSTKYIYSGHDHINDFRVLYQGVEFCYLNKSSYDNYHDNDMIGCVTIQMTEDSYEISYLFY